MTGLLDSALDYARRGLPVLPIVPRGKVPMTAHGLKDATTDVDVVRAWWERTPDANIGVRTDDFVVVDCDRSVGKHKWLTFIRDVGFESSPYAWTGGGGLHVWYRRDDHPVRNRAGWLDHVDIRSSGGYVIVPPSVHTSGVEYRWEYGPDERAVPPMPAKLVDALTSHARAPHLCGGAVLVLPDAVPFRSHRVPSIGAIARGRIVNLDDSRRTVGDRYARAALEAEFDNVRSAPLGQRNDTLVRASFNLGTLVATGALYASEVATALVTAATTNGLGITEALRTVQSGLSAGLTKPRTR